MKIEKAELLESSRGSPQEGSGGSPWSPEVTELLDHLAVELALEYVRLMEQAAEDKAGDVICVVSFCTRRCFNY